MKGNKTVRMCCARIWECHELELSLANAHSIPLFCYFISFHFILLHANNRSPRLMNLRRGVLCDARFNNFEFDSHFETTIKRTWKEQITNMAVAWAFVYDRDLNKRPALTLHLILKITKTCFVLFFFFQTQPDTVDITFYWGSPLEFVAVSSPSRRHDSPRRIVRLSTGLSGLDVSLRSHPLRPLR